MMQVFVAEHNKSGVNLEAIAATPTYAGFWRLPN